MKKYRNTDSAKADISEKYGSKITVPDTFNFQNVDKEETFICHVHGEFKSTFYHIMKASKYGCRLCSPFGPRGWEYMKGKLFHKHGEQYEYYLNDDSYTTGRKLKIICRKHGLFEQRYGDHLHGDGCPTCGKELKEITLNDFLLNAITHHGNSYRYDHVFEDYDKASSKVRIICPRHGIFKQQANDHGRGVGCPSCNVSSRGENLIRNYLIRTHVEYIAQKTFPDCIRNKGKLKYDFYLPKYNTLIEYDGKQHYEEGYRCDDLVDMKANDDFKTNYAIEKGYNMLRIRYDEDSISILKTLIGA